MNVLDSDREILELFCERAQEIADSSIFRESKAKVSINISLKTGQRIKFTETGPEKEALVALITLLRQFYATKQSINFYRVYNIVWKYIHRKDQQVKDCAISARASFKDVRNHTPFPVILNGKCLIPTDIIDLWFNANIFHPNLSKVRQFKELSTLPFAPLVKFLFDNSILELSRVIIYFGSFIKAEVLSTK